MIGNNYYLTRYLRGEDEPNSALWLATELEDGTVVFFFPDNKPFIGQSCPVKIDFVSFSGVFVDLDGFTLKGELGQYSAILTEQPSFSHSIYGPSARRAGHKS